MIFRTSAKLIVALLIAAATEAQSPIQTPVLKLFLPPNVGSETIEIDDALFGPFGAASVFQKAKAGSAFLEIPLAVEGQVADRIKVIAWAPGCRVATFDLPINRLDLHDSYSCDPLPSVVLTGKVEESVLRRHQGPAQVRVEYVAGWGCDFFGFSDCMVPQFAIGTADVDSTGGFKINLPDFASDPACKDSEVIGGFQIAIRGTTNWDTALMPQSKPQRTRGGELKPASTYSNPTLFVAQKLN